MVGHVSPEVATTVLECCHHHETSDDDHTHALSGEEDKESESLQSKNRRLRDLLEQILKSLQSIYESPCFVQDCPHDLYARLVDTMEFLTQLKSLHHESLDGTSCKLPSKEARGTDLQSAEILIDDDLEEPSRGECNVEERSGIDNESFEFVSKEHVLDEIANLMAECILANPKAQSLSPEELQKTLHKALSGMNKFEKMLHVWHAGTMLYVLSTWGLALAGLYRSRTVLKLAALGVRATSKVVLRALDDGHVPFSDENENGGGYDLLAYILRIIAAKCKK